MIRLFVLRLCVIFIVIAGLASLEGLIDRDPEHVKPPSRERPTAVVPQDYPDIQTAQEATFTAYVTAEEARLEHERIEAERIAAEETARLEAARRTPSIPVARPGTQPTSCDGHVIPGPILQRESGCDYGAVNPTGCGGASCVGLYQFDLRHFTNGACQGLDWHNPADQDECARRISNGGTNLRPWGY